MSLGSGRAGWWRVTLLVPLGVGACSTLTGADGYTTTSACTGPACALTCAAQGGVWDAGACTCGQGVPLCGGTCCGSTAPNCVTLANGTDRCSTCVAAGLECGSTCCELGETCLDAQNGSCGSAYGVPHQSCAGGLSCPLTMSDGSTQDDSCCDSIMLDGGTFEMGRTLEGKNACPAATLPYGEVCPDSDLPAHSVSLAPFALDRFEVTVSRFRKFVDAWDYEAPPSGAGGRAVTPGVGWQSAWNASLPSTRSALLADIECTTDVYDVVPVSLWTETPSFYEAMPVNCVSWYEAFVFCVWDGGRLPTSAEWEYAAANGASGDLYPWGEATPTSTLAVYDCTQDLVNPCQLEPTIPSYVGRNPGDSNVWGHRDLGGNVGEWVFDSVAAYSAAPETNPAAVAEGFRITRGGDFVDGPVDMRAAAWFGARPDGPRSSLGFRCARDR